MKLQSLAVLFIIIILPITLVLSLYTQNRVDTINLQTRYDSKLNDATYDALKAYQLNSFNSDTSDYTNSKIRNIKASANTFFNSMASGFSELGYTKETLQNYVPALVYTMYDGYYIYSPYTNTWDKETQEKIQKQIEQYTAVDPSYKPSFENGEKLYGLKPYVYYSCRYKNDYKGFDVTITYSLDNYIQIQGRATNNKTSKIETISQYGYLLSDVTVSGDSTVYKGISITPESGNDLKENIYVDGGLKTLQYIKKNGTKYYLENNEVFSVINGKKMPQKGFNITEVTNNENAKKYYREANDLRKFMEQYGLNTITVNDIVGENGEKYDIDDENSPYHTTGKIFDFDNSKGIESETSNFNNHRIEVIKNSIERNLSIAISNFNEYSGLNFQMPKLKDTDWDKIMSNISIISFLQGVNIGGKIYNGYAIVTNNKNEDIVMEDSIYIRKNDNVFHRITEDKLSYSTDAIGIYNVNIERRTTQDSNGNNRYYFPVNGTLSYDSIVTQNNVLKKSEQTLSEYIANLSDTNLKKIYYTALGRERYGLYRQKLVIPN